MAYTLSGKIVAGPETVYSYSLYSLHRTMGSLSIVSTLAQRGWLWGHGQDIQCLLVPAHSLAGVFEGDGQREGEKEWVKEREREMDRAVRLLASDLDAGGLQAQRLITPRFQHPLNWGYVSNGPSTGSVWAGERGSEGGERTKGGVTER